jgi:hypothetical protein
MDPSQQFKSGDEDGGLFQSAASDNFIKQKKSNKQVELDFCLGPDENGPNAAKRFNDLIAKTLKLQE